MVNHRRSAAEIRHAIISAAVQVVGRRGIDGLTHRAVAEQAGVSLSSTTYHFSSREDIVAAALQLVAEQEKTRAQTAIDALAALGGDPQPQAHKLLLDAIIEELTPKDRTTLRAQYELQLYATDHPHLRAVVRTWVDAMEDMFAQVLQRLDTRKPAQSARLLVAVIDGLRLTALTTQPTAETTAQDRAALTWLRDNLLPAPARTDHKPTART